MIMIIIIIIIINIIINITIIILILIMIMIMIMIIITIHIIKLETILMNTENSKTNEPQRFRLDLTDKLNLKYPEKKYGFS